MNVFTHSRTYSLTMSALAVVSMCAVVIAWPRGAAEAWQVTTGAYWRYNTSYTHSTTNWVTTGNTLPGAVGRSGLAVIGDSVYLFGGYSGFTPVNIIYAASTSNPLSWSSMGTLPTTIAYMNLAVIGDSVYSFGGVVGGTSSNAIYAASTSNPHSWSLMSGTLPAANAFSQVAVIGDSVYLFGGYNGSAHVNTIYAASTSNPTSWSTMTGTLPTTISFSHIAVIGDSVYLFGGAMGGPYDNEIFAASTSNPTSWSQMGSGLLPSAIAISRLAVIGDSVYLFGGYTGSTVLSAIYAASTTSPLSWTTMSGTLPTALMYSEGAIIGDYVYLFGGNTTIFASTNAIFRAQLTAAAVPTVLTNPTSNISATNASFNGTISVGTGVTQHGFAISTSPTLASGVSTTTLGAGSEGAFSGATTTLTTNTTYYVRAYATNAGGTGYGAILSFTTGNTNITRRLRLFEGSRIKFFNGKVKFFGM